MARITIVTPGPVGSNPRVVKEADALTEAGHDVRVVATRAIEAVEARDHAVAAAARWRLDRVDFGRATWRRERLRQEAARRLMALVPVAGLADAAQSAVTRRLTEAAAAEPADLYIAHYVAALPAAAEAARRHGARFAFDAEDFHAGEVPATPATAKERALVRRVEARHLPRCTYVSAASPLIADAYAAAYGIARPAVVLNVFPRKNAPPEPSPHGSATPGPGIYWFSQTIGPGRGIETAVEAIARAESRPHLYLRGTPAAGFVESLSAHAASLGVAERLHILAPALPEDMERLGAQYDLGYVGEMAETESRRIALTNKLFSYLLGGVPSLASDIPAHRAIAADLGEAVSLFATGDVVALAAAMDSFLRDPARLARARAHAWHLGQSRYCWEVEQGALLDAVSRVLPRAQLVGGPAARRRLAVQG